MSGYAANDDELLQISSLDFDTRVEILYDYLVRGYNYQEVGERVLGINNDQPGRLPNCLARCYGFQGRNSGSYRNVSRQLIEQFVDEYWPDDAGTRPIGSFEQFLRKYREAAARQEESARREREAQQRAAEEERRRAEAQRREEARRQAEARRLLEAQCREEARRQEEERRRAEAQRQRELEERRRREQKEQEDKKKREQLVEQGKRALAAGRYNVAYQALRSARAYGNTRDLNLLLAEAMAKAGNAADFANDIIRELTEYEKHYKTLPVGHYRYLGDAYLAAGNKNAACTYLFKEGDVYYDRKDFARADQLYTEAREKSGYYESRHAFRIAYAHSEAKPREQLTEQDDRDCIAWYEKCRDEDGGRNDETVYVNLGYHHNRLKEYDQSVALLKPWAERGSMNKILLGNLANACYALEQWNDAIRWYERQAQCGAKRNAYRIGAAKARMGNYGEAFKEFLRHEDGDEEEAYKDLFNNIENNGDSYELADRRVEALQAHCGFENDTDEVLSWYHEAIEAGNAYAAGQMLQEVSDLAERVAEELLDKARDALKSGDYDEARALAEKAQELNETGDGSIVLAESQFKQQKYAEAEQTYLLALERAENKQKILQRLADTAKRQGSLQKMAKYRLQLMQLGCLVDGEAWLVQAESAGAGEIAAEMLALLPNVRRRREEEQRRLEEARRIARLKAARKRREEEALLMLM